MRTEAADCAELEAARAMMPRIAALAESGERDRRVADELVDAMVEAGLVQMAVPRAYGGTESHLADIVRVIEAISYADASTGWCLMNYQTTAFISGLLEPRWAELVFAGSEPAVPAGVLAPTATGRFVDGGMRVTGRWAFASGCNHANWMMGTAVMTDSDGGTRLNPDGSPEVLLPLFSRDQFKILDTWHVSGLCATGSHDVEVDEAFVPAGRWLSLGDSIQVDEPLYRFPIVSTFPPCVAGVTLGIARAALDYFVELATDKTPAGGSGRLSQRASAQIDLARAEAGIDSARAYVFATLDELWRTVEAGEPVSEDARRRVRLAGTHAAASAAQAVDSLFNAAGASSIAASCPLQRQLRDVRAATQHVQVSYHGFERMGKLRLTGTLDGVL